MKSHRSLKFGQNRLLTAELAALERLKKSPQIYNGRNVVATLVPSFLICSSSDLQVMRSSITAGMCLNIGQVRALTAVLAILVFLKN